MNKTKTAIFIYTILIKISICNTTKKRIVAIVSASQYSTVGSFSCSLWIRLGYMYILKFNSVEEKIITIRGISVILDSDVAELYGVETREINQALKNNPEKFPEGYLFILSKEEKNEVIKNFDNPKIKFSPSFSTAFTEKGLYMLATILKSHQAT